MESCEMTKILVMFTSTGTSGGVFTGLCFQILRVHVYRAQNWCLKPLNDENSFYVYNLGGLALAFFLCESVKMVAVPVNTSKQTV